LKITDGNGSIVWEADYEPFGGAILNTIDNQIRSNFRLPGQYYDNETGLHYNMHRYYWPDTGRYITPDPISFPIIYENNYLFLIPGLITDPIQLNPYLYAKDNPLIFTDPNGLKIDWECYVTCLSLTIPAGLPAVCGWCIDIPPPVGPKACAICGVAVVGAIAYACTEVCEVKEKPCQRK
jgi:RHS repeat-associated protein